MRLTIFSTLFLFVSQLSFAAFRPPAVPLVVHDPYFSVWSTSDRLTGSPTKHWTGKTQSLASLVRIDGHAFRIMGTDPKSVPALEQTSLQVLPTRTIYEFAGNGVAITLTFLTPAIPNDLDLLSRPATYITWTAHSTDGQNHNVDIYFDASAQLAVNIPEQRVDWSRYKLGDVDVLRLGSQEQPVLQKSGDDLRIDWGYLYVFAPAGKDQSDCAGIRPVEMDSFISSGKVPDSDDLLAMRPYAQPAPALSYAFQLGSVGAAPVSRHLVIAYDDLYSIEYFHRQLRPYWARNGAGPADLIQWTLRDYEALEQKCKKFDEQLMADLNATGGSDYAQLCALAYRQTIGAHKLVADLDGVPLFFSKENFSNGSIDTVDVTYPSSPFFLLFNTKLLKGQLKPILDYASLPRWRFPFAPHDLGRYPLANGQQYGGGEATEVNQMPVEESGNMMLMIAAMEKIDGSYNFAKQYWPLISKWAEYLDSKGLDPENQLCTDDFAGHLAHNANLSIKAILALGAYSQMAAKLGHADVAQKYERTARSYAQRWVQMADDGDHFKLAFDKPGTWSQKYNLVWDTLLDLNLFPKSVAQKAVAFYDKHANKYGLPLDNRATYTKIDWLAWTGTLSGTKEGFERIFAPAYLFADQSPSRVPLTDWYDTVSGKQVGFQARSVVGGLFIKLLGDKALAKTYEAAAR